MKTRLTLLFAILFSGSVVYANSGDATWLSSNTLTVDTLKSLCGTTTKKALLHGVCVNDAGGSGQVSLFNSRGSATNPIAVMRSTAAVTSGCQYFDLQLSSGLTYTNSTANDNITIIYNCY